VPLTITRAQRDAIYEIVIPHLTAIGDVWLCVKRREFAEAKKTVAECGTISRSDCWAGGVMSQRSSTARSRPRRRASSLITSISTIFAPLTLKLSTANSRP
jgi:hypothetical protein